MATVSILIPAFKTQFLGRALISAQQQTFEDIEILVGDDTPGGDLEALVRRVGDSRVQYFHHGFQNGSDNARQLWQRASGKYVKWLFDDDILMPNSVEILIAALREHPESALAFHGRVIIDGDDQVTFVPPALVNDGERVLLDRAFLAEHMVANQNNFVGEPSNIMLNRELVDLAELFGYRSLDLLFLADVAMFLNLSERAPIVAVGGYGSAFRQHAGQNSSQGGPSFSAGLFEWEMMLRGEAADGRLHGEALAAAKDRMKALYANWAGKLPELGALLGNLDELTQRPSGELFDSARYQSDLANARVAVTARVAARKNPAHVQNFCAICEQPVEAWLAHPNVNMRMEFMEHTETVGSILDKHNCPHCYCNDRDRHLWLYIAYSGILENAATMRILHIAPEARVEPRIRRLQPREYIAGDLFPHSPDHRKINVEALDFPDGYFDLIICNHVLEHVDNPDVALAEFSRCLAPGGHLVAQTPYSPILKRTFELNKPASVPFKTWYFGQDDHVRLFGADIVDYFRAAGLNGDLYPHATVLGNIDADAAGCNVREPFFLFARGEAPVFAS
ncbi:methyltransferase domain-containing protein [Paraburkholderia sp. GAS42]|uniref:methyltransferase domain-containing protein n=1 Tax=Paraburkholderia sp. GAS42 TaxID=3035135 RepID=UPI003D2447C5